MIVRLVATIGVLVAFHASVEGAIIVGPTIAVDNTSNTATLTDWGIEFTAQGNSTLVGFHYVNKGLADTLRLKNISANTSVDIGSPNSVKTGPIQTFSGLNLALVTGNVYQLLGIDSGPGDNGKFVAFAGFPLSNADISVTSGVFSSTTDTNNWFSFRNISTSTVAAVPEPASAAFLGLGSLALVVRRLRRRNTVIA